MIELDYLIYLLLILAGVKTVKNSQLTLLTKANPAGIMDDSTTSPPLKRKSKEVYEKTLLYTQTG